jgi:hypothetical protein
MAPSCCIQDPADHQEVVKIIEEELRLPSDARDAAKRAAVSMGSSRLIQIGSVYCLRNTTAIRPPQPSLCYSPETAEQLELLAASMRSKVAFRCVRRRVIVTNGRPRRAARHNAIRKHCVSQDCARARAGGSYGQRLCSDSLQPRVRHRGSHRPGGPRLPTGR